MGSDVGLREKLDIVMEVVPASVLDCGNSSRLTEELGNCASNTDDDSFNVEASLGCRDRVTATRVNGHDTFCMEGSIGGHGRVTGTSLNGQDIFPMEGSPSGHDRVTSTRMNVQDLIPMEGSAGGDDGITGNEVNGHDTFPTVGSPGGHDLVIDTIVNGEDTCGLEVARSGHVRVIATRVNGEDSFCMEGSPGGHDGVMSTRVNGQDNFPMEGSPGGHDRIVDTGRNGEHTCGVETVRNGHDGVIDIRVNKEDTFCMEGSLGGHDGVMITRVNGEDTFCREGSLGSHDGVTATRVNGEDTFCIQAAPDGYDRGTAAKGNGVDSEVDIVGNVVLDKGEGRMVERDSDETECSSSFGFTDSESGVAEASGDMEVESELRDDDAPLMGFNGCSDLFRTRKKKMTSHWRDYIRPLMWRLKWAELHIRELQSQASKYGRKLADYDRRKQCELEKCATEDNAMKLTPFVCQNRSVKVMKRKKRKRVEEAVDLASYTSCHSLLSYFASKRSGGDSAYLDDDNAHSGKTPFDSNDFGNCDWSLLEFKDGDALESILRKIEETQSHARKLRLRMDTVVRDAENFASHKSSFSPRAPLPGYGPNSVLPRSNVETVPLGSVSGTCQQSSITGDVTHLPNMTTTTDQPHFKRTCKKIEDKVLISKKSIKKELNDNEDVQTLILESQSALEGKATNGPPVSDTKSVRKVTVSQEQPAVKLRLYSKFATPKNKKKRGRRKARTGRWSQRSSG